MSKRVAIIGGGMLGLSTAYFLAKSGYKIEIFEKNNSWGGLASGFRINGNYIERYYHHWFKSDTAIQDLIEQLGLSDRFFFQKSSMGVYYDGKVYPFSTSFNLINFSPIPLLDRMKAGLATLKIQGIKDYAPLKKVSALDWCNKNFGKKMTKVFWEPLLKGKFGDEYQEIAMSWLWARVHDRSSSRPNPLAKEKLGYMEGSFQTLIDGLVDSLSNQNVKLNLNSSVSKHMLHEGKHILEIIKGDKKKAKEFDLVIGTVPGPIFTKIFNLPKEVEKKINKVKYIGASCMLLVMKKSLIPYYWLNVNDPSFPFMAVIEHTNFIDKSEYQDRVLVYIAKYLDPKNKLFAMNKEELFDHYIPYLQKINEDFDKDWVEDLHFFKSAFAQHIVNMDFEVPPVETGVPGLLHANFAQIYPHDRGTNYAVEQAESLAKLITEKYGA